MFKRTRIHSLTSMITPCNLWLGKIPLDRLSQSQRARQKLWNVQFPSLFFQLQAMQKRENPRVIIFFSKHMSPFLSWPLCSTTDTRLKVHSSLTRTSEVSRAYYVNNIFTFKKQEKFSWHKCKTAMFQHIIYFMVGMWSYLRASRKWRRFYHPERYH